MPDLKHHLDFDEKRLKKNGIIYEETDGTSVHRRMDRNAKKYGPDHRDLDYWHSAEGIRDMIDGFVDSIGIYPQTATDYVRIAYGHRCLDSIASRQKRVLDCGYSGLTDADWRGIHTRAYKLFRRYGYHKKVYQPRR